VIVVDTNIFVRYIVAPMTPQDVDLLDKSTALFDSAADGSEQFTTSDAVVAEVVFALTHHYRAPREMVAERLQLLLGLPGCRMPTKKRCVDALALWEASPKLSIVDAMAAVQARNEGLLATFDRDLARMAGVPAWTPPS
jgi:predicted nucleic acid-binding protein